jgi:hypothetical protein
MHMGGTPLNIAHPISLKILGITRFSVLFCDQVREASGRFFVTQFTMPLRGSSSWIRNRLSAEPSAFHLLSP